MRKQVLVYKQAGIFLTIILISYFATFIFALFLNPAPLANTLGFLALVAYIATLLPTILKTVFPATKRNKVVVWLLKYRRYVGITAFGLGLDHGIILTIQTNLDLLKWHTYVEYYQGVLILIIFTILAITSNNWSVKKLKKNWKKLHQLTYVVIFLLPWHILDKMSGHWSYLTPLGVSLPILVMILFMQRKLIEAKKSLT